MSQPEEDRAPPQPVQFTQMSKTEKEKNARGGFSLFFCVGAQALPFRGGPVLSKAGLRFRGLPRLPEEGHRRSFNKAFFWLWRRSPSSFAPPRHMQQTREVRSSPEAYLCPRQVYRGTSLIRNRPPLGPYSRALPRALW